MNETTSLPEDSASSRESPQEPGPADGESNPAGQEPLPPAAISAWRSLLQAHSVVVAEVERRFRIGGLPSLSWYDVLSALNEAPARRLRHGDLAERVALSRSGLSRLLDRMEADAMVRRRTREDDRRGSDILITEQGVALLRRMWPVYSEVLDERFAQPLGIYAAGVRDALDAVAQAGSSSGA